MKTSQDYPLQIDSVSVPDSTGKIGMTFCPGKKQRGAMTGDWHRDLTIDLDAIQAWCATVIVNLIEDHEMAVNHGGDSDSTGVIAGNLLGLLGGEQCLPPKWLEGLELREVISELADDLFDCPQWRIGMDAKSEDLDKRIWEKCPGY